MVNAKIGVRFCGGCNPQINRSRIYKEINAKLPGFAGVIPQDTSGPWDIGIMMAACPVACVDTPEIRKLARQWVLISGAMVDLYPVEESEIARVVVEKCNQLMGNLLPNLEY